MHENTKIKKTRGYFCCCCLSGSLSDGLSRLWLSALSEAVSGASKHSLQVSHATSASRASALRFLAPVVLANARVRVAACGASFLLYVIRANATATAQCVRFVVSFTETLCTLRHFVLFFFRFEIYIYIYIVFLWNSKKRI